MLKNKDTVKLIAGSTRLVSAATPDALKAMAKTLLEIAAGIEHGSVIHTSGTIKFNNDSVQYMEVLSDIKFKYKD